ncbi:hypothetical protein CEUSTIGMA_g4991.t1 [Chlamydomonas eustigma]|uniref:J domain-containing protein n=1 Tax=Chlamydomonas eustigma TaxID=1157962 RepID=A0A250X395_9CHLO|nr:hypothetical protein CEUSTIGMA_g4991.t1 [Chlamydomonas eustigma]|eukprot:GAX77547.1 hypothetical protein CEUSTIGMA_g4991.t1 [Chlamydomonas eustigma]
MSTLLTSKSRLSRSTQRYSCRVRSRPNVIVNIQSPYNTLGVTVESDDTEIKRAYRKLALKWHPDVSKQPDADKVFLQLTEAYEFLMGRLRGKELSSVGDTDWDFHDWYWNFKAKRTWSKQHTVDPPAEASPSSNSSRRSATQAAGAKANIQSQLAGLRHRAAVRSHSSRPPSTSAASQSSQCDEVTSLQETGFSPSHARADATNSKEDHVHIFKEMGEDQHLYVHTVWHNILDCEDHHVLHSVVNMEGLVHDNDLSGVQPEYVLEDDSAASGSSTPSPRRKFVAHSGSRDQVMGQLAGLRRKVAFARG